MSECETILNENIVDAANSLLRHYSLDCPDLQAGTPDDVAYTHASSIGFADDQIRGSITLMSDASDVRQLGCEAGVCLAGPVSDWLGELANQTIGRFKSKLHNFGLNISIGLPASVKGRELERQGESVSDWYVKWGDIYILLLADFSYSPELCLTEDSPIEASEEGSLELF